MGMAIVEKTAFTLWSINESLAGFIKYSEEELIGKSVRTLCKTEEDFKTLKGSIDASTFKHIQIINKQAEIIHACFKAVDIGESILLIFKENTNEVACSGR
jgi:hypothetical protein